MKQLLLVSALLLLSACGAKKEKKIHSFQLPYGADLESYSQKLQIDESTPNGVGALLSNDGLSTDVGLCTWFLIDKDLAMTNSHCIPDDIKADPNKACSANLKGAFKTFTGTAKRSCKKLVFATKLTTSIIHDQDIAIIQLDRPILDGRTFDVTRLGAEENDTIFIHTMNHSMDDNNVITSEYLAHECVVRSSDILGVDAVRGTRTLIGFKAEGSFNVCKTIGGNSGSPVINNRGDLIGVLHAGIRPGAKLDYRKDSKVTDNIGIFTNLRCLKLGNLAIGGDLPDDCQFVPKEQMNLEARINKQSKEKMEKIISEVKGLMPQIFDYDFENKKYLTGTKLTFKPKCVIEKELSLIKENKLELKLDNFLITPTLDLDYYGKANVSLSHEVWLNERFLLLDLEELRKGKKGILRRTSSFYEGEAGELSIGLCQAK